MLIGLSLSGRQETLQKLASYLCFTMHNAPDAGANG